MGKGSGRVSTTLVSTFGPVGWVRSYIARKLAGEPLDVEGYPQAPAGLDLEQVHVYVRHGVSRLYFGHSVHCSSCSF